MVPGVSRKQETTARFFFSARRPALGRKVRVCDSRESKLPTCSDFLDDKVSAVLRNGEGQGRGWEANGQGAGGCGGKDGDPWAESP
jgi:hypothetical protein